MTNTNNKDREPDAYFFIRENVATTAKESHSKLFLFKKSFVITQMRLPQLDTFGI